MCLNINSNDSGVTNSYLGRQKINHLSSCLHITVSTLTEEVTFTSRGSTGKMQTV